MLEGFIIALMPQGMALLIARLLDNTFKLVNGRICLYSYLSVSRHFSFFPDMIMLNEEKYGV